MNRDIVAPTSARRTSPERRRSAAFRRSPVPPASRLSTPMPTMVDVSTVVLSSWMPNWRAVAFCMPNVTASPAMQDQFGVVVIAQHTGSGQDRQRVSNTTSVPSAVVSHRRGRWPRCRANRPPMTAPLTKPGKPRRPPVRSMPDSRHEPEAQEDHVAGHVGDEDVTEHQHADRSPTSPVAKVSSSSAATVSRSETGEVDGPWRHRQAVRMPRSDTAASDPAKSSSSSWSPASGRSSRFMDSR